MARGDAPADIGLVGLAVMGQNLALNMADHGTRVAVFNRTGATTDAFLAANRDTPGGLAGCRSLKDLVRRVRRPRRVVLLVRAGSAVDAVLDGLVPLLDEGDVVVDCGNSLWTDTARRQAALAGKGIGLIGSGVSGGEEGARFGPSLMPGGDPAAWETLRPVWEAIAAKVDGATGRPLEGARPGFPVSGGEPCVRWIGPGGAGHYVKMVHNGIEYADMQLIAEAYMLLRELLALPSPEISKVFRRWNRGDLDSFLIQITAEILRTRDPDDPRRFLIDVILDAAGQKGTGRWTSVNALDAGVPAPTIAEAVFARYLSALVEERTAAAALLRGPARRYRGPAGGIVEAIRDALYCSKVCAYAQGFALMARASGEEGWKLDPGGIAKIWRGGCIIRARLLQKISEAYRKSPDLPNLLVAPSIRRKIHATQGHWRRVVSLAASKGIPAPAFSSALAYFDGYRSGRLPASLIQAQRDFFGAHMFERIDAPRGRFFHADWPAPRRRGDGAD